MGNCATNQADKTRPHITTAVEEMEPTETATSSSQATTTRLDQAPWYQDRPSYKPATEILEHIYAVIEDHRGTIDHILQLPTLDVAKDGSDFAERVFKYSAPRSSLKRQASKSVVGATAVRTLSPGAAQVAETIATTASGTATPTPFALSKHKSMSNLSRAYSSTEYKDIVRQAGACVLSQIYDCCLRRLARVASDCPSSEYTILSPVRARTVDLVLAQDAYLEVDEIIAGLMIEDRVDVYSTSESTIDVWLMPHYASIRTAWISAAHSKYGILIEVRPMLARQACVLTCTWSRAWGGLPPSPRGGLPPSP